MRKSPSSLTAQAFYQYVKCPNWVYWELFGDPAEKGEVPKMLERLREDGVLHEKEVVAKLGAHVEISAGTNEERFKATLEAMNDGALIYQGVLMHGDWVGNPDLLRPTEGESKLGKWTYEAVDIKSSHEIKDVHKLQLVFYAMLLKEVQGQKPELGRIVNVDGEELAFPIEEAEADFFEALERILAIRAGEKPEAMFTSGCKESPWYEACKKDAEAQDDVSLLYKVYKNEVRKLKAGGFDTVAKLAAADPEALRDVPGISDHRIERLRTQAVALKSKEIIRIEPPALPEAEVELHFDIEGDPMQGVEYLHGLLVREGGKDTYHAFTAERPEDEGKAWTEFCDFIEGYVGAPIYHYGWYERDAIRRLTNRHGISKKAAAALDPVNMIDLVRVVQRCAVFPLYFYSLKDVAKFLGFRWRASDASGANSVLWFQDWQKTGDRAILQKITDYNEDDVRATAHLKDWLIRPE